MLSFKVPLSIQKHIDNNNPVQVRFIKAGTMEKLVESLASDTGELESTYINVFLATYRTFASPKQVLNLLTERLGSWRETHSTIRDAKIFGIFL